MSAPARHNRYTFAEYLAFESSSNVKHEYLGGEIYAMAGGTPEHGALALAVSNLLFAQLRGGRCRCLDSDVRVRVPATGLDTYPDLSVVCGPWQRDPEDPRAVVNPTVVVEVLSPSTEAYDRGEKFDHYQRLPSLRAYLLVSQDERAVEVRTRDSSGAWTTQLVRDGGVVTLDSIGARLDVRELYEVAAEPPA